MLISRAVTVKSKVTPSLKAQLGAELQRALREVEQEMKKSPDDKRQQELSARKDGLMRRLKDIADLKDGQEIVRGEVQGFCEVRVGDIWPNLLSSEIVVEDGRVVAIREGTVVSVSLPAEGS